MAEWFGGALKVLSLLWGERVRVKVSMEGPIGLRPSHQDQYVITVANRNRYPISVESAALEIGSAGYEHGFSAGRWQLPASPRGQVTIPGLHQEQWMVSAFVVDRHLTNKDLDQVRARGVVMLGTGRVRRSHLYLRGDRRGLALGLGGHLIGRPRPPGF